MVKVNGELLDVSGKNIGELLAQLGYDNTRVAVEINEQIVPKAKYSETFVNDGDTVEVVRFVGGG